MFSPWFGTYYAFDAKKGLNLFMVDDCFMFWTVGNRINDSNILNTKFPSLKPVFWASKVQPAFTDTVFELDNSQTGS